MSVKASLKTILFGAVLLMAPFVYPHINVAHASVNPDNLVRIEVFERDDCTHCKDQKAFFKDLQLARDDLQIIYHDVTETDAKILFNKVTELENIPKVTPTTLINFTVIQGFDTPDTTGRTLLKIIEQNKGYDKEQITAEDFIAAGGSKTVVEGGATCDDGEECEVEYQEYWVNIPFYGTVDVGKYSLPTLSLVLGLVDGFNPCAMWVLVLFLTILLEAGSRRRMFEMAGLFILAEGIMYYLILNVWMTTWDFVGLDNIITPIVGLVAIGAGTYFLYNFYKADTSCKVGDADSKRKTAARIKQYATVPMTIPVALGILGLAFSVNIIEFACSVGIPQTFTKVLDLNYLSFGAKQFYNALYIMMYMIDDIVVFGLALYSFDKIGLTTAKYTRFSHFVGGIIMVILGIIMLADPTLLVFG